MLDRLVEDAVQRAVLRTLHAHAGRDAEVTFVVDSVFRTLADPIRDDLARSMLDQLVFERLVVVRAHQATQRATPIGALGRRLADGEISREEFDRKRAVLLGEPREVTPTGSTAPAPGEQRIEQLLVDLEPGDMVAFGGERVGVYVRAKAGGEHALVATWPADKPGAVRRHTMPPGSSLDDATRFREAQISQREAAPVAA